MLRLLGTLVLVVAGCTSAPPDPSVDRSVAPSPAASAVATASSLPRAPTDIVLRMSRTGGHLYPGMTLDVAPNFTLYRDGSVIYLPSAVSLFGPTGPGGGLRRAVMNDEQVDALVQLALGPGGLADAAERYIDVAMADGLTTNFTTDASGVTKTVAVYALGDEMEPGPETAHRERFALLASVLGSFETEIGRGNATDDGVFEPAAYRVTIIGDEFGELAPSGEWPWEDLAPDDFERNQSGFGIRVVNPDEAAALFELPAAEIGDPVAVGPDGLNYLIRYRPLLPDEID